MFISSWFLAELKIIDPNYSVEADQEAGVYKIENTLDLRIPRQGGGWMQVRGKRTVDVFERLDDAALDTLRARKKLGEQIKILENPMNELAYWARVKKEAEAKQEKVKDDRLGEAAKKMVKFATSETFNMPGKEIKKENDP